MYKFVTSMVLCGLGMQQCAMHNATIQKTTFFELGVCMYNTFPVLISTSWNHLCWNSVFMQCYSNVKHNDLNFPGFPGTKLNSDGKAYRYDYLVYIHIVRSSKQAKTN